MAPLGRRLFFGHWPLITILGTFFGVVNEKRIEMRKIMFVGGIWGCYYGRKRGDFGWGWGVTSTGWVMGFLVFCNFPIIIKGSYLLTEFCIQNIITIMVFYEGK